MVSALVVAVITLLGIYFSFQVKVGEDALDMLPDTSLQGDFRLLQQLGMINRIFISLEIKAESSSSSAHTRLMPSGYKAESSSSSADLLASAAGLGSRLADNPLFSEVFYRLPPGYEFQLADSLKKYLPLLTDGADLDGFAELLTPQELRRKLREDFLELNSLAGLAMGRQIQEDPLGFTLVVLEKLSSLRGGMRLRINDGFFVSEDGKHCLLWAESKLPLTGSANGAVINRQIEDAMAASLRQGVSARIIGPLPHTLANAETIRHDLSRLLPIAIVCLVLFLLLILRDWRALLLVAVPFLAAPPAIALLAAVHGEVSAMALGFGIVLLGIGVDFAVHIYLGCRPGNCAGRIPGDLRKSLLTAFLTTILVFAVLLLSKVPAHRQMALLAIIGLSWALFLAWQLVPLLARNLLADIGESPRPLLPFLSALNNDRKWRRLKVLLWLALLGCGLTVWPSLRYNGDLRALDVPSDSIRAGERAFAETWGGDQDKAFIVAAAADRGRMFDINDQVYNILQQEEGLIDFQSLTPLLPGPVRQAENLARWRDFQRTELADLGGDISRAAVESGFTARAFQPFVERMQAEPQPLDVDDLLRGPLRPFVSSLYREIQAAGAGPERDYHYLAATIVPDNVQFQVALDRIDREVPGASVLSNSRWRQKVESELRHDIIRLSVIAALLVVAVCFFFFRKTRPVMAVLAPVSSALAAMAVFAWLSGGELNIMHALMGIMVIGLSVDYGIFIVGACRAGVDYRAFLAVSICAVSTLSGFGVLSFAVHPALHALGVTVLVGIGAAWPVALFVTPVLLAAPGGGERSWP